MSSPIPSATRRSAPLNPTSTRSNSASHYIPKSLKTNKKCNNKTKWLRTKWRMQSRKRFMTKCLKKLRILTKAPLLSQMCTLVSRRPQSETKRNFLYRNWLSLRTLRAKEPLLMLKAKRGRTPRVGSRESWVGKICQSKVKSLFLRLWDLHRRCLFTVLNSYRRWLRWRTYSSPMLRKVEEPQAHQEQTTL